MCSAVESARAHMALLGVVNRRGRYNRTICSVRGKCLALRSRKKTVFRLFDCTY